MQILNYRWIHFKPHLILEKNGKKDHIELMNSKISFILGEKKCTGYVKTNKIYSCNNFVAVKEKKCQDCMIKDYFYLCIKCDGSMCINEKRRDKCRKENYFIYLSVFDDIIKVGISQSFRLMERLVEQGADFGVKIFQISDGKTVRKMENQIMELLKITDRVSGIEKQKKFFGNPNTSMRLIFNSIKNLQKSPLKSHMTPVEIYDLRDYYNIMLLNSNPIPLKIETGLELEGDVKAVKGNIMAINTSNGLVSVNINEIIGRKLEIRPSKEIV